MNNTASVFFQYEDFCVIRLKFSVINAHFLVNLAQFFNAQKSHD